MIDISNDDKTYKQVDFSQENLAGKEFQSCQFVECSFANCDLSDCDFIECKFENCNLAMVQTTNTGLKDVQFKIHNNTITAIYEKKSQNIKDILELLSKNNLEILDILTEDGDLEDVFIQLTNN